MLSSSQEKHLQIGDRCGFRFCESSTLFFWQLQWHLLDRFAQSLRAMIAPVGNIFGKPGSKRSSLHRIHRRQQPRLYRSNADMLACINGHKRACQFVGYQLLARNTEIWPTAVHDVRDYLSVLHQYGRGEVKVFVDVLDIIRLVCRPDIAILLWDGFMNESMPWYEWSRHFVSGGAILISGPGLCFEPVVDFVGKKADRTPAWPKP